MKPSKQTVIAVSILKSLDSETPTKGRVIADKLNMTDTYFAKITKQLRKNNLIATTRGINGGYINASESTTLWDVITCFEPEVAKFYNETWNPIFTAIKESAEATTL